MRWHAMMSIMMIKKTSVRVRRLGALKCLYDVRRWRNDGLGGSARNAMEKSREDDGDEGVTMIAGSGDFSVAKGKDRSVIER